MQKVQHRSSQKTVLGKKNFAPEAIIAESAAHYGEGQSPAIFWRDDACGAYLYKGDSLLFDVADRGLNVLVKGAPLYFV